MKYDFGTSIQSGSTMEWAFNRVKINSTVLELGPAVGTLTRALKQEKNCLVDIVEIDLESGKVAKEFANKACIGYESGNLDKDEWKKTINEGEKYDYIILLDVIEHVTEAKKIMGYLYYLLKEDGEILLSTPNIAHNSIILGLLKNEFRYNSLGILDETHVHFYTCNSLKELIAHSNFYMYEQSYIQKCVENTEFEYRFEELDPEVAINLRGRQYGDAYQFLVRFGKKKEFENEANKYIPLDYSLNRIELYSSDNKLIKEYRYDFSKDIKIEITSVQCQNYNLENGLRICISDYPILLHNFRICYDDGKETVEINGNWTKKGKDSVLFLNSDSQIIIKNKKIFNKIIISFKIKAIPKELVAF